MKEYAVEDMSARNEGRSAVPFETSTVTPVARMVDVEQVLAARSNMPAESDVADLADVFGLLGEPSRVRILIALLNGRMCVRDLAAAIDLSESAVSHALRLLRAHRVVEVHRIGRIAYYEIADSHVRVLLELGLEHVGHTILLHPATPTSDGQNACERHPAP
ncbi:MULTISPECIES: metalloregulator ArsR/SmtB family transcription factor [Cryobacterium]|uniref:ArsR/SmtB family transcription factor n=1 Tax=Cryobacterium TaxID=69578 RepID=UPI0027E2BA95|nr:metalloregulator ArsR/SmtB family transcription factor [Cryobacterium sp. 1639]